MKRTTIITLGFAAALAACRPEQAPVEPVAPPVAPRAPVAPAAPAAPASAPASVAADCAAVDGEAAGAADDALVATATAWVDALARRDLDAASRLVPTMNCRFEKSVAECQRREALRRDEMRHVAEELPGGFAPGRISIRRDASKRGSATVLVHSKAEPCAPAVPVTVVLIGRKSYVDVAISRETWNAGR